MFFFQFSIKIKNKILEVGKNDKNRIRKLKEHCNGVCKKEIDPVWIETCLNEFERCYVAFENKTEIKGVLKFIVKEYLEVTLLCSNSKKPGLGRELINYAINFSNSNRIECKLKSVPKARGFYLRCGFLKDEINITSNNVEKLIPMYYPFHWLIESTLSLKASLFINIKKAYNDYIEIPMKFELFSDRNIFHLKKIIKVIYLKYESKYYLLLK